MDKDAPHAAIENSRAVRPPAIVVGIDGSLAALRAAEWAADEAVARRAPLLLVQAIPAVDNPAFRAAGARFPRAFGMLENASGALRERRSSDIEGCRLEIETQIVRGQSEQVLIEMSRSAALIVLGVGDIGFFAQMVLGSTALAVARDAHCPTALIRQANAVNGTVLVVVTAWETAGPALPAGFRAAAERDVDVIVVRLWHGREWTSPTDRFTAAAVVPDAQIAHYQRRFPTVAVRPVTVVGDTVDAIERFSAAAQLVVVGHESDQEHPERLGRIANDLVRHAPCPVLVIPDRPGIADTLSDTTASALPR
ncbi:hypothetical protein GFY24_35155 [Nocardia sp. SYP-A9097]|uniref:universal stress protein n=1 Tax=Nocardia sp. SYP-A9097 TaxID=2663237 RepID=UPI00129AC652|nr:universal stress protein [Nocardia sp. SYP-A9097]MRH92602.1 hypothetical protein [Nocardia sp. SYP-A9097]